MNTQLEQLKDDIEDGASCVEAYERVDLDQMRLEGHGNTANKICMVLKLIGEINDAANID